MIKTGLICFYFVALLSCRSSQKDEAKPLYIPNTNLISFQSKSVMNMDDLVTAGDNIYREIASHSLNPKTDTIVYKNEQIYISYLTIVNGCSEYAGDFEIIGDSLILKLINIGEFVCAEERADRVIFKIKNEGNIRYKTKKL